MNLAIAAVIWTLTVPCTDDVLWWSRPDDPDFATCCVTWDLQEDCRSAPPHPIGCFDGTLRIVSRDTVGNDSENPLFLRWEPLAGWDTVNTWATWEIGRFMEWEEPCAVNVSDLPPCPTGVGPPMTFEPGTSALAAPQNLRRTP